MPVMEAMAMELPAIATNCTGLMDFMTEENSYLIPVESYQAEKGWKIGRLAVPSLSHTRSLMREVYTNREEAKERGKIARKHIVENFSQEAVAQHIIGHLQRIQKKLRPDDD